MTTSVGGNLSKNPKAVAEAAEILKAVAHPVRLSIIALLVNRGAMNVGAMAEELGVQQPIITQQLRILRMRNLVLVHRANGSATYQLAEPHLKQLIRCMEDCCPTRRGE